MTTRVSVLSHGFTVSPCRDCPDVGRDKNKFPCASCVKIHGPKPIDPDASDSEIIPQPPPPVSGKWATLASVREQAIKLYRAGMDPKKIYDTLRPEQTWKQFRKMMYEHYAPAWKQPVGGWNKGIPRKEWKK